MLIRFLSYLASIIGARRYKPLLISCLALVLSIASISVLISTVSTDSSDAASTVRQEKDRPQSQQQTSSPGLNGFEQKPTKDEGGTAGTQQQNAADSPQTVNPPAGGQAAPLDITLNTATISLSQDSPDAAVTVTASENSKLQWSITPSPETVSSGLNARIEQTKDTGGNAVIRFRADRLVPGVYQFTVTAKTVSGTQSASKTISVTVN